MNWLAGIRTAGGLVLVGLGVVGTLFPIVPGIPLVIAGVALLGANHPAVRPLMVRLRPALERVKQ